MSKATPGPWTINEYDFDGEDMGIEILGNRGGQVPSVIVQTIMVDIKYGANVIAADRANARFIASAPGLLAALKAAVECGIVPITSAHEGGAARHARHVVVADMIRAAIAKAEGSE